MNRRDEAGWSGRSAAPLEKLAFAFFAINRRWNARLGPRLSSFDPLFRCTLRAVPRS